MQETKMKEIILTDKAQQPGGMPYSQAIKVGNTVYVAGQGPFEPVRECATAIRWNIRLGGLWKT